MNELETVTTSSGEEVMKAVGELSATKEMVSEAVLADDSIHEEVEGWLTTIFKALLSAFK
ncbi:MAG TPA: hypothetical protein VF412_19265 [Bdellovibrio sp.]|uniref:hypothetical protein n=1 Tax=Bdellovibrio sp. TaxID=28201 RepID=UPI002EED47B2